jgi:hypothetical protein
VSNPKSLQAAFKSAAKGVRSLANSGPAALKSAFNHIAKAFDQLAKLDFTNPASLNQLTKLTTSYAADFQKIAAYFAKQCNFTIPTTPSS